MQNRKLDLMCPVQTECGWPVVLGSINFQTRHVFGTVQMPGGSPQRAMWDLDGHPVEGGIFKTNLATSAGFDLQNIIEVETNYFNVYEDETTGNLHLGIAHGTREAADDAYADEPRVGCIKVTAAKRFDD